MWLRLRASSATRFLLVDVDAHAAAAVLQRALDLRQDLVVARDGLLGLGRERHPDARHVHGDDQRPDRQRAARLLQLVVAPRRLRTAFVIAQAPPW